MPAERRPASADFIHFFISAMEAQDNIIWALISRDPVKLRAYIIQVHE